MNKRRIMIIAGLLFFALIARFGVNEVHAAMNLDGIFYQNLINWVPYCYSHALVDNITINEYNSGTNGKKLEKLFLPDWKPSDTPKPQNGSLTFYIPSLDIGNNKISAESPHDHGRAINCYAAFGGDGNTLGDIGSLPGRMVGLLEKYNVDMNNAQETLERMGYEVDSGTIARSTEGYCYTVYVEYNTAQPVNVGSMCKNDEDYDLGTDSTLVFSGGSNRNYIVSAGVYGRFLGSEKRLAISVKNTAVTLADISSVAYFGLGKPTVGFYQLQGQISGYVEVTRSSNVGFASDNQRLKKSNNYDVVVNKISNGTASIKDFTSADMYNLYIEYLKKNYGFTGVGSECVEQKPSILVDTNAHEYYIWSSGQWCLAGLNPNLVDKRADMTVFWGGDKKKLSHVVHTLPDLINLMGDLDYNDGDFDSVATIMEEDEYSGEKKATCKNSAGAKSLGWIVCPILEWVSDAVDDIYTDFVEPNLQLKPMLFGNVREEGGGEQYSGTYEAWTQFRDFANIVFIVLFLVVIFSQLTGVGIDNYGIKKIMPKLIVVAILINLSYVICMVLVDVSNIVGSGIQSIFNNLGKDISSLSFGISGGQYGDSNYTMQGNAVTAVAILGAIGVAGAILANPAILLSLLVSAIGILISIFFLFVLLAAREAAVIVLVVLSPLAFVCYMLPNTKKMFDRWWKLFEGLLLVYPIAGLMVGGGNYVSKLLMATGFADENQGGSFVTAFTAMMVGILPIFFIPMVLKGSFAAMGKVGGMLSGLGQSVSKRATSGLRSSERFQHAQKTGLERRDRLAAQRRAGGYVDANGQFHERGLRSRFARTGLGRIMGADVAMGRARDSYVKTQISREDARANLGTDIANYQLQQAANARTQNEAAAAVGVPELTADLAEARARSSRRAQELKGYTDQYANLTRSAMGGELQAAVNAYNNNRSEANMTRLQAALQTAESRGMNKEMLASMGGLQLSASNSNDAEILNQMAGSNDKVIGQFGKQMAKPDNATETLSMNDFAAGTGGVKMSEAFASKGTDALVGANDDTLEYIKNHGGNVSSDMLMKAASSTSDLKELRHINDMLGTKDADSINITGSQLAKIDNSTLQILASKVTKGSRLQQAFVDASNDIRKSPELLNNLNKENRKMINTIRRGAGVHLNI